MKIGVSSPAFAYQPFLDALHKVAEVFDYWEIVADLKQLLPDIANEFKLQTPSYDLGYSVHAPFNDLNLAALNHELREIAIDYIKRTISTAAELEIDLVSFHPGHFNPTGVYYKEKIIETNQCSIEEIAKFAEEFSITLAIENMPLKNWTLGNSAEELLGMIDGHEMGICFDIGHAFILDEVDNFLEHIEVTKNVHMHDNNGRRDEHLVLGEGAIDIQNIIQKLHGKYAGNIIIECNNIEEGVKSKEYLSKMLDSSTQ